MLWCQHVVDIGLADGKAPFGERSVADKVELRVVVSHIDVESESLKWFTVVQGIEQCQGTEEKTAGVPGEFMTLVGFHQGSLAYMVHNIE
jgi:hypothetical protein